MIASLEHEAEQPIELPNTEKLVSRVFGLEARLRREPAVARGQLRDLLRDGTIRMDVLDGWYLARGTLFPYGLVLDPKTQHAAGGSPRRMMGSVARGGGAATGCFRSARAVADDVRVSHISWIASFARKIR